MTGSLGVALEELDLPSADLGVHTGLAGFGDAWLTGRSEGRLRYAEEGGFLFVSAVVPPSVRYAEAVRALYAELFALTKRVGYPTICRLWHYIGRINGTTADGLETYRDFCVGRALAFEEVGATMPAASAVGSAHEGVSVCLLATRAGALTAIENPLQVPAYRYPGQHGPKSPSFSRATYLRQDAGGTLFLSGTASILGHETAHPGDLAGQLATTFGNVEAVVHERNLARHGVDAGFGLADFDRVTAYVRHADDLAAVEASCRAAFGAGTAVRLLRADLCRSDLLVEVEGVIT
ncbi:FkbO/Hyg5 family chorismatase [Umezawaea endophytica]|uniref:FkbO/Hyg5 family chorismatase n=1 Tax=Umezawaea endophytica TaxID=1654476 RepID=A0A9X2VN16_9PSEU|nr:FkbO/Hyg5 family chorismatase [Umezawaea endophytica]MCS7479531.1 FkbO/Hyg5 family chorismatase [Umezawaea endophytica]